MKDLSSGANERPRQVLQLDVRNQVVGGTGSRGCDAVTRASTAGASAAPDTRVVLLAVPPLAGNVFSPWLRDALWTRHCMTVRGGAGSNRQKIGQKNESDGGATPACPPARRPT